MSALRFRRTIILFILLSIFAGVSEAAKKQKSKVSVRDLLLPKGFPKIAEEHLAMTKAPDFAPGAPAVVLLESQEYEWEERVLFKRERYFRRLKILDEAAIEDYGSFSYNLYGNWRIHKISARTVLPDGTVADAGDGIQKETSRNAWQVIQIAFPQVQVGAILDLDIQIASDGLAVDPWTIQGSLPILETRLVMKPPLGLRFRIIPYRLPPEKIKPDKSATIAGGTAQRKAHIWYERNVEPIPDLSNLPPVADISKRLFIILGQYRDAVSVFNIADDWKSWGEAREENWSEWMDSSHAVVAALAKEVAGDAGGPLEKAEAIRRALRDRYRAEYVSRFAQEDTPDEQLAAASGSTGSVAALAAVMLREVGVDAQLAAYRRRSSGGGVREFPVPSLMNDLLVRIPDGNGGHVFFNANVDTSLKRRSYESSGVLAFPFDGEADKPVELPDFSASDNRLRRTVEGTLSADGTLTAESRETYHGIAADLQRARLRDETEEQRREDVERSLRRFLPDLVLESLEIEGLDEPGADLVLVGKWEVEDFATVAGKRLIYNPNLFARVDAADWAPETREYPLDLGSRFETSDTLMLRLPEGVVKVALPDSVTYPADPVGSYGNEIKRQGKFVTAKRTMRLGNHRLPAEYYTGARRWFSEIAAADDKPVVVELE